MHWLRGPTWWRADQRRHWAGDAVAGAVVGNAIERVTTKEEAVEVMVQLRNGERRAIVQAKGTEELRAGDPVIIVTTGGKVRVTRAPAVVPATPAGAPAQRS